MAEWTDNYFGAAYGWLYSKHLLPASRTRIEAQFAMQVLELRAKTVLDVAAGFGRHARIIARYNQVLGLDRSHEYLLQAKRGLGKPAVTNLDCVRGDMRHLPCRTATFDAAICLFNSFGYFASSTATSAAPRRQIWKLPQVFYDRELVDPGFGTFKVSDKQTQPINEPPPLDENLVVLDEIARILKPRASLLLELPNPRALLAAIEEAPRRRMVTGTYEIEEEFSYDNTTAILSNRTRFKTPDGEESAEYSLKLYEKREIVEALKSRGLRVKKSYGSYTAEPFHQRNSEILLIHATRSNEPLTANP